MTLQRAIPILEHARRLDDAADPMGRARSLEGMIELVGDAPSGFMDRLAEAILAELPAFGRALAAAGRPPRAGTPGVGVSLAVMSATLADAADRISLCALFRESFRIAAPHPDCDPSGVPTLAARRLRERFAAFRAGDGPAPAGPGIEVGFKACTAWRAA